MFVTTYKVTSPKVIEEFIEEVEYKVDEVLVKVDYLAICKADIRYYLGNRDINVLKRKYPLTPIHEAVGKVVKDPTGTYKKGDKVILIPNSVDKERCKTCYFERCKDEDLGENYCPYAEFKSSTSDGFMRPFISLKPEALVKYDDSIEPQIAVWSELLSVSNAACRRIDFSRAKNIALFGDGIMGYMVYIILTQKYHAQNVTLFGMDDNKMSTFKGIHTTTYNEYDGPLFDTLIECVGGRASSSAINQMIDISQVGSTLILMGVSENLVEINTRKVLEKGITIKGVTRSTREDFEAVSKLIAQKEVHDLLAPLVLSETTIKTINDVYDTYEKEIKNTTIIGKNILKF